MVAVHLAGACRARLVVAARLRNARLFVLRVPACCGESSEIAQEHRDTAGGGSAPGGGRSGSPGGGRAPVQRVLLKQFCLNTCMHACTGMHTHAHAHTRTRRQARMHVRLHLQVSTSGSTEPSCFRAHLEVWRLLVSASASGKQPPPACTGQLELGCCMGRQ